LDSGRRCEVSAPPISKPHSGGSRANRAGRWSFAQRIAARRKIKG